MGGGVECAAQGGTTRMPLLCAGNWDTLPLVGGIALLYPHNKFATDCHFHVHSFNQD